MSTNPLPGGLEKLKPVDMEQLAKDSQETMGKIVADLMKNGIGAEDILKRFGPAAVPFLQPSPEEKAAAGGPATTGPAPAIPDSFNAHEPMAAMAPAGRVKHPMLVKLEGDFGIKKLKPKVITLGDYQFMFRPPNFANYEWTSAHVSAGDDGNVPMPSLQVTNVASGLAAVNDVPLYELFGIDTSGRHIADPLNPPPDIKEAAMNMALDWFRHETGLWEVIPELDRQYDALYEEDKLAQYPLLAKVANPLKQRIAEALALMQSMKATQGGNFGAGA